MNSISETSLSRSIADNVAALVTCVYDSTPFVFRWLSINWQHNKILLICILLFLLTTLPAWLILVLLGASIAVVCIVRFALASSISVLMNEISLRFTKKKSLSLLSKIWNTKIGLACCARSIVKAENVVDVLGEAGKISAMLGLEEVVTDVVISKAFEAVNSAVQRNVGQVQSKLESTDISDAVDEVFATDTRDFDLSPIRKHIPLIATGLAMAGHEVTGVDTTKLLNTASKNVKAFETIEKHVTSLMESAGLIENPQVSLMLEIMQEFNDVAPTIKQLEIDLRTDLNKICRDDQYADLKKLVEKLSKLEERLQLIVLKDATFINNVQKIRTMMATVNNIYFQVEQNRISQTSRPEMKCLGIMGEPGCGKSTFSSHLIKLINAELRSRQLANNNPYGWSDCSTWTTWEMQSRDEFDTGYVGQQHTYCDDAFQDREQKDHMKWITFASNVPIGTVQADIRQKGTPFISKSAVVTWNITPTKSSTIQSIEALWRRFENTIEVVQIGPHPPPGEFDPHFNHLMFYLTSMQRSAKGLSPKRPISVLEIVKLQADAIESAAAFHMSQVRNINYEEILETLKAEEIPETDTRNEGENINMDFEDLGYLDRENNYLHIHEENIQHDLVLKLSYRYDRLPQNLRGAFIKLCMSRYKPQLLQAWNLTDLSEEDLIQGLLDARISALKRTAQIDYLAGMKRALDAKPTYRVSDLAPWIFFVYDDGVRVADRSYVNGEEIFAMLSSLGTSIAQIEDVPIVLKYWKMQKPIKLQIRGQTYIWSPHTPAGLIKADKLKNLIVPSNPNVSCQVGLITRAFVINSCFALAPNGWMGALYSVCSTLLWEYTADSGIHCQRHFQELINTENSRLTQQYHLWGFTAHGIASLVRPVLVRAMEEISRIIDICKETMLIVFYKITESLGIKIPYSFNDLIDLLSTTVAQAGFLTAVTLIALLVYKLIRGSTKTAVTHSGVYRGDRQKGKRQRPHNKIRKMNTHSWFGSSAKDSNSVEYDVPTFTNPDEAIKFFQELSKYKQTCDNTDCLEIWYDDDYLQVDNDYLDLELIEKNTYKPYRGNTKGPEGQIRPTWCLEFEMTKFDFSFLRTLDLTPSAWSLVLHRNFHDGKVTYTGYLSVLTRLISGKDSYLTKKDCKELDAKFKIFEDKIDTPFRPVSEIILHDTMAESHPLISLCKSNVVQVVNTKFDLLDSAVPQIDASMAYGIGNKTYIMTNWHVIRYEKVLKFWRYKNKTSNNYGVAELIKEDEFRDLALWRIVSKKSMETSLGKKLVNMSPENFQFSDIDNKFLSEGVYEKYVTHARILLAALRSEIVIPSHVDKFLTETVMDKNALTEALKKRHWYRRVGYLVRGYCANRDESTLTRGGDCGSPATLHTGVHDGKIIGIYSGVCHFAHVFAFITREDWNISTDTRSVSQDPWYGLLKPNYGLEDTPEGPGVQHLGLFHTRTLPISRTTIDHWHKTPFADEFETLKLPAALSATDKRIKVEVPKNREGKPTLLVGQNAPFAKVFPPKDPVLLQRARKDIGKYLQMSLDGDLETCIEDIDEALDVALNSKPTWQSVKPLVTQKSSGLPWNLLGAPLKSDFIEYGDDGVRKWKDNNHAKLLINRIKQRYDLVRRGIRPASFSNSKLKDECVKISKIEEGKTRVTYVTPIESLLTDAIVFGPFKEAFSNLALEGKHTIGFNPCGSEWQLVYEKMTAHPNTFDGDFKNYDKHMTADIMETVFGIITDVIDAVAPDNLKDIRQNQVEECIRTWLVDYQSCYSTGHGNKSGTYLTTIVNIIANWIYSYYCFLSIYPDASFQDFSSNVNIVSFGDDVIESVSDEYRGYNYFSKRDVLAKLGITLTPGNKDGVEKEFIDISELTFCKRQFKLQNSMITAPLEKRSIEAPFVWTQNVPEDTDIWRNLVTEQLTEACLWGKEYYDDFLNKLTKCSHPGLKKSLAVELTMTYEDAMRRYARMYHHE